ncbi:uncharacterized protein [Apostichopus japonicus]|uniref:uncharacterized protein isoform X2 n=1 Tax=Stichopus japonicus TaxID=307972 RepID=UPI003AB7E351
MNNIEGGRVGEARKRNVHASTTLVEGTVHNVALSKKTTTNQSYPRLLILLIVGIVSVVLVLVLSATSDKFGSIFGGRGQHVLVNNKIQVPREYDQYKDVIEGIDIKQDRTTQQATKPSKPVTTNKLDGKQGGKPGRTSKGQGSHPTDKENQTANTGAKEGKQTERAQIRKGTTSNPDKPSTGGKEEGKKPQKSATDAERIKPSGDTVAAKRNASRNEAGIKTAGDPGRDSASKQTPPIVKRDQVNQEPIKNEKGPSNQEGESKNRSNKKEETQPPPGKVDPNKYTKPPKASLDKKVPAKTAQSTNGGEKVTLGKEARKGGTGGSTVEKNEGRNPQKTNEGAAEQKRQTTSDIGKKTHDAKEKVNPRRGSNAQAPSNGDTQQLNDREKVKTTEKRDTDRSTQGKNDERKQQAAGRGATRNRENVSDREQAAGDDKTKPGNGGSKTESNGKKTG